MTSSLRPEDWCVGLKLELKSNFDNLDITWDRDLFDDSINIRVADLASKPIYVINRRINTAFTKSLEREMTYSLELLKRTIKDERIASSCDPITGYPPYITPSPSIVYGKAGTFKWTGEYINPYIPTNEEITPYKPKVDDQIANRKKLNNYGKY